MAKENFFVFMEEGGAGRAIVAKAMSQKAAEKNIHDSIGGQVRFAAGATKEFRKNGHWGRSTAEKQNTVVIRFEKREALVEHLYPRSKLTEEGIEQKPLPIRYVYEGPLGKVGIAFNDRTMSWEAYCSPEGADGREVMFPLTANSEEQAALEAEAVLRDEANHNQLPRPTREEAAAAVKILIRYTGDNPNREGLLATPDRVVRAYRKSEKAKSSIANMILRRHCRVDAGLFTACFKNV